MVPLKFETVGELETQINLYFDDCDNGSTRYGGDSSGQGDMPMEYLQAHTRLPVSQDSHVKFTLQSKNEVYLNFESAIYREIGDPLRFTYPAVHPLAAEFE